MIRIVIVDDHALVRSGLRRLLELEREVSVVGEASSADEAIEVVGRERPDVVLLDLTMPGTGGLEAIAGLRRASPETGVLIVTMHDDALHVRSALSAGALGYVVKSAPPAELVAAVRDVHARRPYYDSETQRVVSEMEHAQTPVAIAALSRRERQVLSGLVRGHTNREIADQLGVGVKSIESYRARLRAKLGADTRADLVRIATEAGFLD